MENCKIYTLYSGSKGNAVYFNVCGHEFLIDAGKSARALCSALNEIGTGIEKIEAIFITHEHSDHIAAAEVLSKKYRIPIHICSPSAKKVLERSSNNMSGCLISHPPIFEEYLGEVRIRSFVTPHDSLSSVGYRIDYCENDKVCSVGLATDIGHVTDSIREGLLGCSSVILESNHDIDMLLGGTYPVELKHRILSSRGHLSNDDCAAFATFLVANGTKNIMLAHLSEENNIPSLALAATVGAVADESIKIMVADSEQPSRLV